MAEFQLIPSIDVRGGMCVRLYQGDFRHEKVYSKDPVEVACWWAGQGANWIHVVDLDGALAGEPQCLDLVSQIAQVVDVPLQVGGGIRTLRAAAAALKAGAKRIVVGTIAVENPELVRKLVAKLGDKLVVAIDAENGIARVRGWTAESSVPAARLASRVQSFGVSRLMYTDITRDGTLTSPNYAAIKYLLQRTRLPVLASGGVSCLEHVLRLRGLGCEGAVVGTALYAGKLNLPEAYLALGGTM